MTAPGTAAELTTLADHIDAKLSNEHADRQYICEETERRLREIAARLRHVSDGVDDDWPGEDDDTEAYCLTCREWVGIFLGLEGWHHFRGDWAPGGVRALFDAGHAAKVGWTAPPGRGLSPAGLDTLRQALGDAIAYREPAASCADCEAEHGGLCYDHAGDLDKCDAYGALAESLGVEL